MNYKVIYKEKIVKLPPKEFEFLYFWQVIKIKFLQENNLCVKFGDMIIQEIQELLMYI